jgi:XTP/dITP diphosphohydrolase
VARIVLLVTSPRLPAGLLTADAWQALRAYPVLAGDEHDQVEAVRVAGVPVRLVPAEPGSVLAAVAEHGDVVWLAGPSGDEPFARELGLRLAREPVLAELELMYGSWDPPGARLLDVVAVMDRLVSPGGDPWKHEQTHQTLAKFLLEEAYEAYDAISDGDLAAVREELGDVLLQVVLHARMAEDATEPAQPWTIDDLAGDLVAKLVRRNPHVFGTARPVDVDEIVENWEQIKRAEKARGSALDGIAAAQPALSLTAKILSRAQRAGLTAAVPSVPDGEITDEDALGAYLFAIVADAWARGWDAEAALRRTALAHAAALRTTETIGATGTMTTTADTTDVRGGEVEPGQP